MLRYFPPSPPDHCCCSAQINTKKDVDHDVVIGIGFLTSYEHMGMAYLECRSGCKCKRKELQGMIDVKASQTDWCAFRTTVESC